jgi:signal transduction histidine kinase
MHAVRLHPRHQGTLIQIDSNGQGLAWFDPRKLERALYNLLLNACEAAPTIEGRVLVTIGRSGSSVTIAVSDNGPGIAEPIRDKLFHPFVSYGKENGTGLGLTVVQKIVQDHGGEVLMERTADARTVFRITIPGRSPQGYAPDQNKDQDSDDKLTSRPVVSLNNEQASENSIRHSDT